MCALLWVEHNSIKHAEANLKSIESLVGVKEVHYGTRPSNTGESGQEFLPTYDIAVELKADADLEKILEEIGRLTGVEKVYTN